MTLTRLSRPLAAFTLTLALAMTAAPARAQAPEEPPAEGEGSGQGRPLDGYFATLALTGMTLFIVCKTARRS